MALHAILKKIPSYAKDIKHELDSVYYKNKFHDIASEQLYAVSLVTCYALKHEQLINVFCYEFTMYVEDSNIDVIKSAFVMMSMYTIFYRSVRRYKDPEMAASMIEMTDTITHNPGMDKTTFNMCQLAMSVINDCSFCVEFYTNKLLSKSVSKDSILNIIRLVALLKATADTLETEALRSYELTLRGENI